MHCPFDLTFGQAQLNGTKIACLLLSQPQAPRNKLYIWTYLLIIIKRKVILLSVSFLLLTMPLCLSLSCLGPRLRDRAHTS